MMKHNKGKIKREHGILPDFLSILKDIEQIEALTRIIPGRIRRKQKGSSHFFFSISYPTDTGIKCIMKKGGTAQELFLIGDSDLIISGLKQVVDEKVLKGG